MALVAKYSASISLGARLKKFFVEYCVTVPRSLPNNCSLALALFYFLLSQITRNYVRGAV